MEYSGYIVVDKTTGNVVGGYPRPGDANDYTRLGDVGRLNASLYDIIRVEGAR
jgi:hypothetical protein